MGGVSVFFCYAIENLKEKNLLLEVWIFVQHIIYD